MSDCILVVDDDREIVKAISILLEGEGYEVLKAYDGLQALDILASKQVRLVLFEVWLPTGKSRIFPLLSLAPRVRTATRYWDCPWGRMIMCVSPIIPRSWQPG